MINEYKKVCAHCEQCQNSPYGDWYCVDENGKIIKEITNTQTETCNKFRLSDICKRFIKNMEEK